MNSLINNPNLSPHYKFFPSNPLAVPFTELMPQLKADESPLSAAGYMTLYLTIFEAYKKAPKELKPIHATMLRELENSFSRMADGSARHSDGRMKIVPDAQYLRLVTPQTPLVKGAVDLSDSYNHLPGQEFSKAEVDKYCGRLQSQSEAKNNPVGLAIAEDKSLLNHFVDARYARIRELSQVSMIRLSELFGFDSLPSWAFGYKLSYVGKLMGIYAPHVPEKGAIGLSWGMSPIYMTFSRSNIDGGDRLDRSRGRLIVVSGAQHETGQRRTLEQAVRDMSKTFLNHLPQLRSQTV